jgi:hypothetical protein
MELIRHEMAHLSAFRNLAEEEGITEEVCLKFGETFDAAMTDEAWTRLKGAFEEMRRDHGDENDVVRECRLIEDAHEAEEYSQMKGALAAVVHPAGQMSIPPLGLFTRKHSDKSLDGHTDSYMLCCVSCSKKEI